MTIVMESHLVALRDSEATAWLAPPPELFSSSKVASERLFESIVKYVPKGPLPTLLTEGFDAEQIWQQIELRSKPLISAISRHIRPLERLEHDGDIFGLGKMQEDAGHPAVDVVDTTDAQNGHLENASTDEDKDVNHDEEKENISEDVEDHNEDGESEDDTMKPVEDEFLKLKDMQKFLDVAEDEQEEGALEEGDEDEEMDDLDSDEPVRYDDFFVKKKKETKPVRPDALRMDDDDVEDMVGDEEHFEDDGAEDEKEDEEDDHPINMKDNEAKSTHEKQVEKMQKRIKELEKANLDPKDWTMGGEITANRRPKNSALEVELEFDHNIRPAPIITEEANASIEDLIRSRIIEGRFDDPVRKERLPEAPPAERKEIDETKSKQGLGDIYEADYMQSTGLASAPTTETEELRKKAADIFKSLCIKLDALSHFHFAPKPAIEDMTIKAHVPALAMEEVAPVFVSEASMIAPEEIFQGTGAIKDEKELTPSERKQRRASKKRKHSAQQKLNDEHKKPRLDANEKEIQPKKGVSEFSKSSKVFAELERAKTEPVLKASAKVKKLVEVKGQCLKL